MPIRVLHFITTMLASLSMAMAFAHLLEMPPRLEWNAELWIETTVTGGAFRLFGSIGAVIETTAWIAALVLSFSLRHQSGPAFSLAATGAALMIAAYAIWWLFVFPANQMHATWTPEIYPPDWERWRNQWEYAHASRAVLLIFALGALVLSALNMRPTKAR